MFINVPSELTKRDIKYIGNIFKDSQHKYILSDVLNQEYIELNSEGFYSYIYNIGNKYLFIIGNQKGIKDINPKKIDFINKILFFEYIKNSKPKKIQKFNIPSHILTITSKDNYLKQNLDNVNLELIKHFSNTSKKYLLQCNSDMEMFYRYLCDNEEGYGIWEHGLSVNILIDNYIEILKDTSISGYIIKYNHDFWT